MRKVGRILCSFLLCASVLTGQFMNAGLSLHTIQAADAQLENVALHKPVTASNTAYNRGPELAVDGNKDNSSFWDGGSFGNYITVDLGGYYDISSITVYPYWDDSRYYHYTVLGSLNNQQYEEIAKKENNNISVKEGDSWNIDQKLIRYVRVQIDYNSSQWGSIQLCELEVFGKEHEGSVYDNIAAHKPVTANTIENSADLSDGDIASYLEISQEDTMLLDLEDIYTMDEVKLQLKAHSQFSFTLYGSKDGDHFKKLAQDVISDSLTELAISDLHYKGRYLKLQVYDIQSLHMSEFQVFGEEDQLIDTSVNLSKGKKITASATANNQGAANAIDGNLNSYWDGGSIGQYVTVDLEDFYRLDHINIVTYFGDERYYKYAISISTDGENFTPVAMKYDDKLSTSDGTLHDMKQMTACYVRVSITYNSSKWGSVHLNELEIYGTETDFEEENLATQADVYATSSLDGHEPEAATDENLASYWQGASTDDVLTLDLHAVYQVDEIDLSAFQQEDVSYVVSAGTTLDTCDQIIKKDAQNAQAEEQDTFTFKNMQIRYVQVRIVDHEGQAGKLAEIALYGKKVVEAEDGDIAFGKPVRSNVSQNFASVLTDQNAETVWNARYYPCYVDIDLLDNYLVNKIALYLPVRDAYYRFSVYASKDGARFDKVFTKTNQDPIASDGEMEFDLTTVEEARIIRVQFEYNSASSDITLSQIRLYGDKTNTKPETKEDLVLTDYRDTEYAKEISEADVIDNVYGLISRNLGDEYKDWFSFELVPEEQDDFFEISNVDGKIHIKGNKGISLTTGLYHYLKYYPKVQITEVDQQVAMPDTLVPVDATIRKETPYEVRYAFNYCTLSYSLAFFGEEEWQRELDWLAFNGVNVVLDLNGQEAVWLDFLQKAGYTQEEAKDWLTGPGYYAWQFMCNMETFNGPVSDTWIEERLELARKNQYFMRTLGMETVLQGYSGEIPTSIKDKDPDVEIIPQGYWMSFDRPSMLKTTSASFQKYADMFYDSQQRMLGDQTRFYATDPFHEGGQTGGMSRSDVGKYVFDKLKQKHSQAIWIVQSWSLQADTLAQLTDQQKQEGVMVLDLEADKFPRWSEVKESSFSEKEFDNTPWVFCFLDNFGGRQGVQAELDLMVSLQNDVLSQTNHMKGIGLSAEGTWANPIQYELLYESAWDADIDVDSWIQSYIERRYGKQSEAASKAWEIFRNTAYKYPKGGHTGNPESIINATPRFNIAYVAPQGSVNIPYDAAAFNEGVKLLLEDYDALKDSEGYRFDATDMVRQYISNVALDYYRKFTAAYKEQDTFTFDYYAKRFLSLIEMQDKVLQTNENFLVGTWIQRAKDLGETYQEDDFQKDMLERNARALITTWGSYDMSSLYFSHDGVNYSGGTLQDYANRQYAGLTKDYYLPRWEKWIGSLYETIHEEDYQDYTFQEGFELGWNWSLDQEDYAVTPSGDLKTLAQEIFQQYNVSEHYAVQVQVKDEAGKDIATMKQFAAFDQNLIFDLDLQENQEVIRVDGYDAVSVEGSILQVNNIQDALHITVVIKQNTEVDTTALATLVKQHQADEEDMYTTDSWATFHTAMLKAQALLENSQASQKDIDEAVTALTDAVHNRLQKASASSIQILQEAIDQLLAMKNEYTELEFQAAAKAIQAAQAVLAADVDTIAAQQVTDALLAITTAKGNLYHNVLLDALRFLVNQANAILASDEIDDARPAKVQALKDAVVQAQRLLDTNSEEEALIKDTHSIVMNAIHELYKIVDRSLLEDMMASISMLSKDKYTIDSWGKLEKAMAGARALQDDATTMEVQQAYDALLQAVAALDLRSDKQALADQIAIAQQMLAKIENYIPSSVIDLQDVIKQAQAVYDDEQATTSQVAKACEDLIKTIAKARLKADMRGLETIIAEAQALQLQQYTPASRAAFTSILKEAQALLQNGEADQQQVDQMVKKLKNAQEALITSEAEKQQNHSESKEKNTVHAGDMSQPLLYFGYMMAGALIMLLMKKQKHQKTK